MLSVLKKLVYLLALLCFVVLVLTGFYPTIILGKHLSGYLMMIHATAAPVSIACLAFLALTWAHNCRFDQSDWPWLSSLVSPHGTDKKIFAVGPALVQKICFWLIVLLALPVSLSIVLSMFPLFGTHCQKCLLQIHRYSTLLLALVGIVHIYLTIRRQITFQTKVMRKEFKWKR